MPVPLVVSPPQIEYPIDISYPQPEFNASVVGSLGSVPDVNSYAAHGRSKSLRSSNSGSFSLSEGGSFASGGSIDRFFLGGGMLYQALFRAGAGGIGRSWICPDWAAAPMSADELAIGYVNPEYQRVAILDYWVNWRLGGGAGVFDGSTTGVQLMAWDGINQAIGHYLTVQGGGTTPRVICGIYGRDDGGTQQAQYRAFDEAETQLDDVDIVLADAASSNLFRFVIVAASAGRAATLSVHVNDPLTPLFTRTFGSALLDVPTDFATTRQAYGINWGAVDASGAGVTRTQMLRWRLRCGKFLPDGTEVQS